MMSSHLPLSPCHTAPLSTCPLRRRQPPVHTIGSPGPSSIPPESKAFAFPRRVPFEAIYTPLERSDS